MLATSDQRETVRGLFYDNAFAFVQKTAVIIGCIFSHFAVAEPYRFGATIIRYGFSMDDQQHVYTIPLQRL